MTIYYDRKHLRHVKFDIREIVVMIKSSELGESTQLRIKYRGPLQVTQILSGDTYRVVSVTGNKNRVYATTAHVSLLKSWKIIQELAEFEEIEEETTDNTKEKPLVEEEGLLVTKTV